MTEGIEGLFARTEEFPNPAARARLAALVGLDETRDRLVADAVALLDPTFINEWSTRVHGEVIPAVGALLAGRPWLICAGDKQRRSVQQRADGRDHLAMDPCAPFVDEGRVQKDHGVGDEPVPRLIKPDEGGQASPGSWVRELLGASEQALDTLGHAARLRKTDLSSATPPAAYVRSLVQ